MQRSIALLVALLALAGAARASTPKTVADLVIANKDKGYGILLEAVLAADPAVLKALSDPKLKATVFAPSDHAFKRLLLNLKVTKTELLANKALVTAVLQYHVLGAPVLSSQLKATQTVQTLLEGPAGKLRITKKMGAVRIFTTSGGSAKVEMADLKVGGSVVHLITRVLVPKL